MDQGERKMNARSSIQSRLMGLIALMLCIILLVNLFIYSQVNRMVSKIDAVFASNVTISELTENLNSVEDSVYEYLNTRGSEALENYYRYAQDYQDLLERMNDRNSDSDALMLEKNIRSMSASYLATADATVQAKRGRNVEQYRDSYERQEELYRYINYYIYKLDSFQFSQNSSNYEMLLGALRILEVFSIVLMIMISGICMFIALGFVREMIRPLIALSRTATEVAEGQLDVKVPRAPYDDEVGVVTEAFDKMLQSIRDYIHAVKDGMEKAAKMKERELSMEAHLKEAQLRYLQAQINPHFLFNSLNAGAQLANMEDAESTGEFLERMAEFFRYNVKKTDGNSTLGEEIEAVDNYIYILNVRFAGDITYEKDVEDGLEDIPVPALFLQPLVENAVTHGIRSIMGDGVIQLNVMREDEGIRVTVTDNGAGMSEEMIESVMNGNVRESTDENGSTGIGLKNVIGRLMLYYGRKDLFRIYSDGIGKGTQVSILIPENEGGEHVSDTDRG